jgi:hypothetical protein
MVRYVWLLSLSVGILISALTPAQANDWRPLTMEQRGDIAELIVLGEALRVDRDEVRLKVLKVYKRPTPDWSEAEVRAGGVVNLDDVNPRPAAVSQRLILFLSRSTHRPSFGWECLNPSQGRIDVDGTRASGDFAGNDFRWETRPLAEVEELIRRALPPVTLLLTPARQRLAPAGAARFRLALRNVSDGTVEIPDPASANLSIFARIARAPYTLGAHYGAMNDEERTDAVIRLKPGDSVVATRTISQIEIRPGDRRQLVPWPPGSSLVKFMLQMPSEGRRPVHWGSNSVLVESSTSPAVVP